MLLRCSSASSIKWQDYDYGQRVGVLSRVSGNREVGFSLKRKSWKISCPSSRTRPRKALGDENLDPSSVDDLPVHGLCDTVVGVLGGGQLGRMLCEAASYMGIKVLILDPSENCPASVVSFCHVIGNFDDSETVKEFAKKCGVLTVEIEHVDAATLERLEQQGMNCQPKASTIRIIQDKYLQKVHFSRHAIPLPDFMQIENLESAEKAGDLFGFPLMIKSKKLAYDGRGNAVAYSKEELSSAVSALGGYDRGLYAEKWAPFVKGEVGFHLAHQLMRRALTIPGATVHWYDKPEMRKQRKMGHVTIVGPSRSIVKAHLDVLLSTKKLTTGAAVVPRVAIIMGSDSDLPVMKAAAEVLKAFDVPFEISIVSAHRTPERMFYFASHAHERGVQVIIAGAGGAAHLPGMVASLTPLPVIGVPVRGSSLDGVDSLLSIVQMPKGVPVATVAVGNATNAALLAIRQLAICDPVLQNRMIQYQIDMKETVLRKVENLQNEGWERYSNP